MTETSLDGLSARRPVWNAMARLLTDVMLDGPDRKQIARTLANSPYDIDELQSILLWEVYPACYTLAGWPVGLVGGSLDPSSLERRILRGPSWLTRVLTASLGRLSIAFSYGWHEVRREFARERAGAVQQRLEADEAR